MPKFVVPHVATTAKKVSAPCSSMTRRSAGPVSRPASSAGTPTSSASITSQADAIELCAPRWPPPATGAGPRPRGGGRSRAPRRAPTGCRSCRRARTRRRRPRHPDEVGDPAQGLVLGPHRPGPLEPRPGVDRRRADHEVEDDRGVARRARDEGEVARVVDRQAGGRELVGEDPHRLGAAEAARGDGAAERRVEVLLGPHAVQRRLHPDALLGVRGDGVEEGRELLVGVRRVGGRGVHGRESRRPRGRAGAPAGRRPRRRAPSGPGPRAPHGPRRPT